MAEYIERQAVIELFDAYKWQGQICIDAVKELPTADVAPVVHGRWIRSDFIGFSCSICQKMIVSSATDFCPYCGAKMDLDAE